MKCRLVDSSLEGFQGAHQELAFEFFLIRLEVEAIDVKLEAPEVWTLSFRCSEYIANGDGEIIHVGFVKHIDPGESLDGLEDVRKAFHREFIRRFDDECVLNHVLEFSDVAWPAMGFQELHRCCRETRNVLPVMKVELIDEVLGEHFDIVLPVPQGRELNRQYVESIEEILAELAFFDHFLQVPIRRGYDAHVDLDLAV